MDTGSEMLAPRARSSGIVVRELADETLVYDTAREQAHALDRVTGLVWGYCDGETPVARMVMRLENELGEAVSTERVWQVIAQLAEKNLLEEEAESRPNVMTRRDMMKKVGLATTAVVAISSIRVPVTAAAAACPGNGFCGQACSAPFGGSTGNGSCNSSVANLCDLANPSGDLSCPGTCCMDNSSVKYTAADCSTSQNPGFTCCCHGKTCSQITSGANAGSYTCVPNA